MNSQNQYIRVAVSGPLRQTFTYSYSDQVEFLQPGQRLLVPFGKARKVGFYIGPTQRPTSFEVKEIIRPLDEISFLPSDLFQLLMWIADYYFANPADCLTAALPPALKTSRPPKLIWTSSSIDCAQSLPLTPKPGRQLTSADQKRLKQHDRNLIRQLINNGVLAQKWLQSEDESSARVIGYRATDLHGWDHWFEDKRINPPMFDGIRRRSSLLQDGWTAHFIAKAVREQILEPITDHNELSDSYQHHNRQGVRDIELTTEQKQILNEITTGSGSLKDFSVSLLHGITGSGKTLVYCHLAERVLKTGRTVLVLTPEIALAGLTQAYFRGYFGNDVAVLHSGMTDRERMLSFDSVRKGRYPIVVGPRSALFAPLPNLGLIIVDEEHDSSYKQENPSPRFHGRDCAIKRAQLNKIPIILGSASPSFESFYQAKKGKYKLYTLSKRPGNAHLPSVSIIDLTTSRLRGDLPFFTWQLKKQIEERLEKNEQTILFLNRRGHSPQIKCNSCGHVPACPNCEVTLTYHQTGRKLSCHYCGHVMVANDICQQCGSKDFFYLGAGTQKIEEAIIRLFKDEKPLRLDSDSAGSGKRIQKIIDSFANGESRLLLGTQMVTKGLDLPNVTLVGVLSADQLLDRPDFRASERAFAQLLQVAGRSGRADKAGEVLIQTFYPESEIIEKASHQDFTGFYDLEIKSRESLHYPPFRRLVNILFMGKNEQKVETESHTFTQNLKSRCLTEKVTTDILGPAPCPMYFLRGQYRRHLLLKTKSILKLIHLLSEWEESQKRFNIHSTVRIIVDVDPYDMM